ncbi:hypothetical protein ROD_48881 [Citrobacter rodentium ICC168]|uniref:Uncharacterized protein n=1 Tax=Citrobacter rodentium (strain ICC168) TaxID=637910 RepID=D2TRX9_CITRI|nr:hypothetical protein ROD_48881 [Citrobacter rodentium ICC168]
MTVKAVTKLDNKSTQCRMSVFKDIVHFCDDLDSKPSTFLLTVCREHIAFPDGMMVPRYYLLFSLTPIRNSPHRNFSWLTVNA